MKIKIQLDKGQTSFDAEETLYKALRSQRIGAAHPNEEEFPDPAMQDVADKVKSDYSKMFNRMLDEIFSELDKEYEL